MAARKQEGLDEVAAQIRAAGGDALVVAAHMGQDEGRAELVARTVAHFGKVDVLVNNAATNPHFGPMMSCDWGAFRKTFEVNLEGYFGMTREVVNHLAARKAPGSIINVTSVAAGTRVGSGTNSARSQPGRARLTAPKPRPRHRIPSKLPTSKLICNWRMV